MRTLAHAWDEVATWAGHPIAPPVALILLCALWALAGLDATNFAISIVSLLLLFVLQLTQTRDTLALHIKLDELIRAIPDADDNLRHLEEQAIDEVREARRDANI